MGRALPTPQDTGERELWVQGPPWRSGGPAPPAATLRVLILALLWRGSLSQEPGYSLTVPQSVSVQEGLYVRLPCTFTYPARYDTENPQARLYGYWYKDPADAWKDPPVASTDPNRGVSQETQGRFWLVGNVTRGDCSLQIIAARRADTGRYFLRVERGGFKYSYLSKDSYTEPQISVSDPPRPPNITGTLTRNGRPVPDAWGAECDVVSLVTHEGDSLNLSCEAGSRPEVTLRWNRTNGSLSPGQRGAGRLELRNLSRGDAGEYRCWAENPFGSASQALRVHVQGAEQPGKLLGVGLACGLGVAVGFVLLGLCGVKLRGREPAPPSAKAGESANGSQAEHTADDVNLIYSNVSTIPMDHKTPAARRPQGVQDGAAAAKAPLGPGEPEELHYASVDFSKLQPKGGKPPGAPATEYSEVQG